MNKFLKLSLITAIILSTVLSLTLVVTGITEDDTQSVPTGTTVTSTEASTTIQVEPTTKTTIKVGKVKNLKKTSLSTSKITLKWSKVKNASGYRVYYVNKDKSKTFSAYKDTGKNKITFKSLSNTTPYYFKIAAYVNKGGKKYFGKYTLLKTSTQPAKVKNLKEESTSTKIKLTWSKNKKATGYKIYRAKLNGKGGYTKIKVIKGRSKTSFTDKTVKKGVAYRYKVRAYRTYKATGATYNSGKSKSVTAFAGLKTVKAKTKSQLYKITLTWSKDSYADGYLIYQSTSKNGKYKKIAITKSDNYLTDRLKKGKTYYYKVVAYKKIGSKVFTASNKVVSQKVSGKIFGKSIGDTYIEISINKQHMWFYVKGKLYVETDVVTGNDDGVHNTPKGIHHIIQKESPSILVGADYRTPVDFWLPFTSDGCGIHDSTWRADWEYGGTTYKGDGSHGCVNTPYSKVKKIYKKVKAGGYVIVR